MLCGDRYNTGTLSHASQLRPHTHSDPEHPATPTMAMERLGYSILILEVESV